MSSPKSTVGVRPRGRDRGSVLTTLLITMIPLLMLATAATTVMTSRNSQLLRSIQQTKALLAASAAIEEAAQSAQEGTLVSGESVAGDLTNGIGYVYIATYLAGDDEDNDQDGLVDEADERAFEVIAHGRHGLAEKRLSALVIEPAAPPTFAAAILALGTPEIVTAGTSLVSGRDTRIDGSRGTPTRDVDGIATEPPHVAGDLLANYTRSGTARVIGRGGVPSIGAIPAPYNLPGLVSVARYSASNVLAPGTSTGAGLGTPTPGNYETTYCPGNLHLASANRGAGVLLVTGDLTISGSYRFDGLIVVLGNLTIEGSALVNGAVIQGAASDSIDIRGTATVRFSTEALGAIGGTLPPAFLIEGWREIAR